MKTQFLINPWTALLCGALVVGCSDTQPTTTEVPVSTTDMSTSTTTEAPTTGAPTTGTPTTGTTDTATGTTGGDEIGLCDPWQQDCPDGYKCMAYAEEGEPAFTGTKCTPVVENPGVVGDPCNVEGGWWTGIDDCGPGLACWNINHADNTGQCVSLCTGSEDAYACPETGDICVFWVPGIAHVCLQDCDPLLQDCPSGQACLPDWASGGQAFVCLTEYSFEEGQEFDPCEFSNACDPGLMCWDSTAAVECDQGGGGCCISFCDINNPQCNGEGAMCGSIYGAIGGEPPPEFTDVGLCTLPG